MEHLLDSLISEEITINTRSGRTYYGRLHSLSKPAGYLRLETKLHDVFLHINAIEAVKIRHGKSN